MSHSRGYFFKQLLVCTHVGDRPILCVKMFLNCSADFQLHVLKGQSHDIVEYWFFSPTSPPRPLIQTLKYFRKRRRIH